MANTVDVTKSNLHVVTGPGANKIAVLKANLYVLVGPPYGITSISPPTGAVIGGTAVTISGNGFTGATGAAIDGNALTSFSVVNDTTITGVAPAGTAGAKNVTVAGAYGTMTLSAGFTYVVPATGVVITTTFIN